MDLRIPNTDVQELERVVESLGSKFSNEQALILSEDDLKCHLFNQMYNKYYSSSYPTIEYEIKGCPIHTEIPFYDCEGKLTHIPDITILNPDSLSIKNRLIGHGLPSKKLRLPSKEHEFGGDAVIFELKFCKNKTGISKSNIALYEKDIEKIKKIQAVNQDRNKIFGFFVIFNKTDKYNRHFEIFLHSEDNNNQLKIIYATANFRF
jgi:hypothetical protein